MVVAHKILLSAPVPWIGDLGLGDWGLGLDNIYMKKIIKSNIQSLQEKIRDLSDIECAEGSDPDSLAGRKVGTIIHYNLQS